MTRLSLIPPKHNPTAQEPPDGMSLTRTRKLGNKRVKQEDGMISFNPSITCKDSLAECFRIFTDPNRDSTHLA